MNPKMSRKDINLIRSAVRKQSRRRSPYSEVRGRCQVREVIGFYKNGNEKLKVIGERCEHCRTVVEKVQVDHIIEIGEMPKQDNGDPDWNAWIPRVLCDISNLQGLCDKCHKIKTKAFNEGNSNGAEFYF